MVRMMRIGMSLINDCSSIIIHHDLINCAHRDCRLGKDLITTPTTITIKLPRQVQVQVV